MTELDKGLDPVTAWVILRRYDQKVNESDEVIPSSPIAIKLKHNSTLEELKAQIRSFLDLPEEGNVIKLRTQEKHLITLTSLLEGNTEQSPFLLDVTRVHQHIMVTQGTDLLPICVTSFASLVERVERLERLVPDFQSQRQANVDQIIEQLSTKVSFLDRRLDETAPVEWRAQIQQAAPSSESPSPDT